MEKSTYIYTACTIYVKFIYIRLSCTQYIKYFHLLYIYISSTLSWYNFYMRHTLTPTTAIPYRDVICAALRNDLGVLCKANGELAEAKIHYTKALEIRRYV